MGSHYHYHPPYNCPTHTTPPPTSTYPSTPTEPNHNHLPLLHPPSPTTYLDTSTPKITTNTHYTPPPTSTSHSTFGHFSDQECALYNARLFRSAQNADRSKLLTLLGNAHLFIDMSALCLRY